MYKVDLKPDVKEMAAIEARRNREKDRQSRFFNVRNRVMGVDVEALNRQVQERKLRETRERDKEMAFGHTQVQYDRIAEMLEREQEDRIRRVNKTVQEFWEEQQQSKSGDPDQVLEFPVPLKDRGPHCGPASMQTFLGEHQEKAMCLKLQQEQLRSCLDAQVREQREARQEERQAALLGDRLRVAMDVRAAELARLEESCHAATRAAVADANKALAAKQALQQSFEHRQEQEANFMEIKNQITSVLLTENSRTAQHAQTPHHVLAHSWKGMDQEQLAAFRKSQEAQRREKKEQRQAEKILEQEWATQTRRLAKAALVLEDQEKELCAEAGRGLGSFNQELAKEQQAHQDYLNSVIYTNQPTAHYYLQFNNGAR